MNMKSFYEKPALIFRLIIIIGVIIYSLNTTNNKGAILLLGIASISFIISDYDKAKEIKKIKDEKKQ